MFLSHVKAMCKSARRKTWSLAILSGNILVNLSFLARLRRGRWYLLICFFFFFFLAWDTSYLLRSWMLLPNCEANFSAKYSEVFFCSSHQFWKIWVSFKWLLHLFLLLMPWPQSFSLEFYFPLNPNYCLGSISSLLPSSWLSDCAGPDSL